MVALTGYPRNRDGAPQATGGPGPGSGSRSRDRFRARHGPLWCLRGAPTADEDEPHSLRHARRADNRHWQRAQWNRVGPASYPHFTGAATSLYGPYMGYHTAAAASRCWHAPIRACRQPPASVCWCQCPGSQAGASAHDWIWPPGVSARVTVCTASMTSPTSRSLRSRTPPTRQKLVAHQAVASGGRRGRGEGECLVALDSSNRRREACGGEAPSSTRAAGCSCAAHLCSRAAPLDGSSPCPPAAPVRA